MKINLISGHEDYDAEKAKVGAELTTPYKETNAVSYCEFHPELGVWHNCQDQTLHSVNPRCDPRFWYENIVNFH